MTSAARRKQIERESAKLPQNIKEKLAALMLTPIAVVEMDRENFLKFTEESADKFSEDEWEKLVDFKFDMMTDEEVTAFDKRTDAERAAGEDDPDEFDDESLWEDEE